MGAFTFDVSLGREVEFYERVNTNDPTNSALKFVVLADAGLEGDSVLKSYEDLASLLGGGSAEVTNAGYTRIALTDADLDPVVFDHVNHQILLTLPVQTYVAPGVGDSWSKLLVVYDNDTTGGTDANIIPVTASDLRISGSIVVPNGTGDVIVDLSAGFVVAI